MSDNLGGILIESKNKILVILLRSLFLFLLVTSIFDGFIIAQSGWHWSFLVNYILIVATVIVRIVPAIPLKYRSYAFSLICLAFAGYFYMVSGTIPAPILLLLVSGMTATLLLGMRAGFMFVILNFFLLMFIMFNFRFQWVSPVGITERGSDFGSLIIILLSFLITSVASVFVPGYLSAKLQHEINERKKAEEEVRKFADRQVHLVQEIHHRVKNNMQVLSSMLNLQSNKTDNAEVKRIMENSRDRIMSMTLLHQNMYTSETPENVDLAKYLQSITRNLCSVHRSEESRIRIHHDIAPLNIDMDTCVPIGLIVNELVTNSMKYAFTGSGEGDIWVEIFETGRTVRLVVRDNGVGLSENFDTAKEKSMGLYLTELFVKQLEGELAVTINQGTRFEIEFPIPS